MSSILRFPLSSAFSTSMAASLIFGLDTAAISQISPMDFRTPKFKPRKCWNPDDLSSPEERMAT